MRPAGSLVILVAALALSGCHGGATAPAVPTFGSDVTRAMTAGRPLLTDYPAGYADGYHGVSLVYSLAAKWDGSTFYISDKNYGTFGMTAGTYAPISLLQYSTPRGIATSYFNAGYAAFGYGSDGTLYGLACLKPAPPQAMYLVANPENPSQAIVTPLDVGKYGVWFFDIEADPDGRILLAHSSGLIAITRPDTSAPSIAKYRPAHDEGFFRVTVASDGDIYASTAASIYHLTSRLKLVNVVIPPLPRPHHGGQIDSLAPDAAGGVWYADDVEDKLGHVGSNGRLTLLSVGFRPQAVATAADGSVWALGYSRASRQNPPHLVIARLHSHGAITRYDYPEHAGFRSGFARGTYGIPMAPNAIYAANLSGEILTFAIP